MTSGVAEVEVRGEQRRVSLGTKLTITIGRAEDCEICLPDPKVSRIHCEIRYADGRWILRDRSTNGTVLDGRRVDRPEELPVPSRIGVVGAEVHIVQLRVFDLVTTEPGASTVRLLELDRSGPRPQVKVSVATAQVTSFIRPQLADLLRFTIEAGRGLDGWNDVPPSVQEQAVWQGGVGTAARQRVATALYKFDAWWQRFREDEPVLRHTPERLVLRSNGRIRLVPEVRDAVVRCG